MLEQNDIFSDRNTFYINVSRLTGTSVKLNVIDKCDVDCVKRDRFVSYSRTGFSLNSVCDIDDCLHLTRYLLCFTLCDT